MVSCWCTYHPMVTFLPESHKLRVSHLSNDTNLVDSICCSCTVVLLYIVLIIVLTEFGLHASGGVRTARPGSSDKTRPTHEPHW